ncbi:MAG: Hsp20 family protein [Eubacteriales bacterium]
MIDLVPFGKDRDNYLDYFFSDWPFKREEFRKNLSVFRVDIVDQGESYKLTADLPGVKRENVDVSINGNLLSISVNSSSEENDNNQNYVRRERFYGKYVRSFDISDVDIKSIRGELKDGILTVSLPKKEREKRQSRKIEIT